MCMYLDMYGSCAHAILFRRNLDVTAGVIYYVCMHVHGLCLYVSKHLGANQGYRWGALLGPFFAEATGHSRELPPSSSGVLRFRAVIAFGMNPQWKGKVRGAKQNGLKYVCP